MSRMVASAAASTSAAASAASAAAAAGGSSRPSKRVLVLGGNGFVGSQILRELVARKRRGAALSIASLSRRGVAPQQSGAWSSEVEWHSGDVLQADDERVGRAMADTAAVISCVGGFGNVAAMEKVNGDANAQAMATAKAAAVPRFVYISAHHYALPEFCKPGYFTGKFRAEKALQDTYGNQGVQIRPGFIFGTRQVGSYGLPLWLVGWPLQQLSTLGLVRSLTHLPVVGSALALPLTPPVSVNAVARAAVDAALQEGEPTKQVVEVDDILAYEKKD